MAIPKANKIGVHGLLREIFWDDIDFTFDGALTPAEVEMREDDALLALDRILDLEQFNPRALAAVFMRYGLFGEQPRTLQAIGVVLNVEKERVRQILLKVSRQLRHPSRSRSLKRFVDSDRIADFEVTTDPLFWFAVTYQDQAPEVYQAPNKKQAQRMWAQNHNPLAIRSLLVQRVQPI